MTAERFIHIAVFMLLLVGFAAVTGWASYKYLGDLILKIAGITLSWGIILLALYITFSKLNWKWWS